MNGFLKVWVAHWLGILPSSILLIAPITQAQITSDSSVGSIVNLSGNSATITGGMERGTNLFHSFSEFSLTPSTVTSATFNTAIGIENIITRVTGGSISNINGLIQANGNANLFFLNPNGIVFGEQAMLRIGGSFIASTADRLKFQDGTEFGATASPPPLLTISQPIGLQYGATPGTIRVEGSGHFIFVNPDPFEIVRSYRPMGLGVDPGKTVAIIGGKVEVVGGNLTAEQGQIEIGAIANSIVTFTPTPTGWRFSYPNDATFQDVTFSQGASADVSGNGGGRIQVQARQIQVSEGSSLLSLTLGDGAGGRLNLNATEAVTVQGEFIFQDFPLFPSSLLTEVGLGASGQGGTISVQTGHFSAAEGAKISTSTSGSGPSGLMSIVANTIDIQGGSPNFGATLLSAGTTAEGHGGLIRLGAETIRFLEGGGISSTTAGTGNAGSVEIQARNLELIGGSEAYGASGVFLSTLPGSSGQGGNVAIAADLVRILEGAQLAMDASGSGDTGTLAIDTGLLEIAGASELGFPSMISMQMYADATGNGGDFNIQADQLRIANGGGIFALTNGNGNVGNLTIKAQTVELLGTSRPAPTGIFTAVNPDAIGNGGILTLETQRLSVLDGAQIATDTFGIGSASPLRITAQEIELAGSSPEGSSGLFAGAIAGTGAGGDIFLQSERLTIRDGATISASNFATRGQVPPGQGAAGNIEIQAATISLDRASITASTAAGGKGSIAVRSQILTLLNESSITTNSQGLEPGGNIGIETQFLVGHGNSDITANAVNARGGQVTINANRIFGFAIRDRLTPDNDITASSDLGVEFNGTVTVNLFELDPAQGLTELPNLVADPSQQVRASCEQSQGNQFVMTGRGGLPEDVSQEVRGGTVWNDLRTATGRKVTPTSQESRQAVTIPEAQSWIVRADGQVELITDVADGHSVSNHCASQD